MMQDTTTSKTQVLIISAQQTLEVSQDQAISPLKEQEMVLSIGDIKPVKRKSF